MCKMTNWVDFVVIDNHSNIVFDIIWPSLLECDWSQIRAASQSDEVPELPEPEGSMLKNHLKQVSVTLFLSLYFNSLIVSGRLDVTVNANLDILRLWHMGTGSVRVLHFFLGGG